MNDEPLWSNSLGSSMQIGSIDSNGRFVRYLKSERVLVNGNDSYTSQTNSLSNDDAWNLNDTSSFDTTETKSLSANSNSNMFKFRTKFDKLINLIPLNVRSSSSRSTDDEYEIAEKIAANLVNEVIQINQTN